MTYAIRLRFPALNQ
ncbi:MULTISPECIES: erythromycin resistance leader peptide [Cytobacillus]